jgi:HD-GYP domain-containing protein (c-di-GMP phosphodiesterase class II)
MVGSPVRRLSEYETLLDISRELSGSLNLGEVLETALRAAEQVCHAETSSIWELNQRRTELFFRVVRGQAAGQIRDLRVPLGHGIVGSVAKSGKGEVVNDVSADSRWKGDPGSDFQTRAILSVPLASAGRVIGVLQLLNPVGKEGFSGEDLGRVEMFAGILAPAIENARLYALLKRQFIESVTVLAEAVEKKDPYSGGHIQRVVSYSLLLGSDLGLGRDELEQLRLAAILHDIGKIGVPDQILRKPGRLDQEEREIMRRHVLFGAEIISKSEQLRNLLPGIRSHHERLDGTGYPDGLAGEKIALSARIIAVADTFDAITTSRPYQEGLSPERAAAEIYAGAGAQFCSRVAECFRGLFEGGQFTVEAGDKILASLSEEPAQG